MAVKRMRIQAPCPSCGGRKLEYSALQPDIPYFQGVTQLVFECTACGFRHSDFLIGSSRKPTRHTYRVTREEDMTVRVVRSTSGTVRIPELGVLIEPGPASDAYVSNIEGVLVRIEGILNQLRRDADDDAMRAECDRRLKNLADARRGRYALTFVLEDPHGNSLVADAKVHVEAIPAAEAAELKTGEIALDLDAPGPAPPSGNGHGSADGTGAKSS